MSIENPIYLTAHKKERSEQYGKHSRHQSQSRL